MDTLIVTLSADQYLPASDPKFASAEIWIGEDGPHVFEVRAIAGEAQPFLLQGNWPRPVTVTVFFKNDAWGGTAATDRNLYLLGASLNGVFQAPPLLNGMFIDNAKCVIAFPAATTPPAPQKPPTAPGTDTKSPANPGPSPHETKPTPAASAPPVPAGVAGNFTATINATFGRAVANATITDRLHLFTDLAAYPWLIYGNANTNPSRPGPHGAYAIGGPVGDGTDGLYQQYRSRHAHFAPGSAQDAHVLTDTSLILKAWCGMANGDAADCAAGNLVSGILRFAQPIRPGSVVEIKCKMPKARYAWPAFWLNTGVQAGWTKAGDPGAVQIANWTAEIDVFDQYGFNGQDPGHYLIAGDPAPLGDAAYALPGQTTIIDLPPTFQDIPGLVHWTGASDGWYAHTIPDLTADFHVFGLDWQQNGHLGFYLDGQLYRTRGYVWPTSSPAGHLIASLQIGANFNDLSAMTAQGAGWDWEIQYIRAWDRR